MSQKDVVINFDDPKISQFVHAEFKSYGTTVRVYGNHFFENFTKRIKEFESIHLPIGTTETRISKKLDSGKEQCVDINVITDEETCEKTVFALGGVLKAENTEGSGEGPELM